MEADPSAGTSNPSAIDSSAAGTPGTTSVQQSGVRLRRNPRRSVQPQQLDVRSRVYAGELTVVLCHDAAWLPATGPRGNDRREHTDAALGSAPAMTPQPSGYASPTPRRQRVSGETLSMQMPSLAKRLYAAFCLVLT